MILSSEHVLRAMELRLKTKPIIGSLCSIEDPTLIWNAMKYFQCFNYGMYISNPYPELDQHIYDNMDRELFRIYIELLHHWMPPCTSDEIRSTMVLANKYGYEVNQHKSRISLRRIRHDPIDSSRFRDGTNGTYH